MHTRSDSKNPAFFVWFSNNIDYICVAKVKE